MLFLTRRRGESVDLIDRKTRKTICTVQVAAIMPQGVVRLGFSADPAVVDIIRDDAKEKERRNDEQKTSNPNG